ncbi:response regulator [Methanoregula sp.]|uniref:response regulator n=1 Tax=Methanoregula sp. TaxID=2052170 RepID=UPI0035631853
MKWIGILCLLASLAIISGSVTNGAEPVPDYGKILQIHLGYVNGGYVVSELGVRYGRAPDWNSNTGNLHGVILGPDGKELRSFTIQHPSRVLGEIPGATESDRLTGYTATLAPGDLVLTVPYQQDMQKFLLSDARSGALLVTANLDPTVRIFCTDYPNDPDCLSRKNPAERAVTDNNTNLILISILAFSVLGAVGLGLKATRRRRADFGVPEQNTILIVDDNRDVLEMIRLLLNQKGYVAVTAEGGKECLDILKTKTPDLILLDVMMEPMDGWQTLETIKTNPDTQKIPVLMITGKKLTAAEAKHYKLCIDDYIMKPFDAAELYAAVGYFLERKKKLKETLDLAKKAGVTKEKVCEFAQLTRRITVNRKIVTILQGPGEAPVPAGADMPDTRSVVDDINNATRDKERRAEQLRQEINSSFRSKGLPEFSL